MPASCTCSGAGKSGCPMQKLMMSLPCAARAVTSASTTKAFSVPRDNARLLSSGMAFSLWKTPILAGLARPPRALGRGLHGAIAAGFELETQVGAAQGVLGHGVARVARQGDVGLAALLVVP